MFCFFALIQLVERKSIQLNICKLSSVTVHFTTSKLSQMNLWNIDTWYVVRMNMLV